MVIILLGRPLANYGKFKATNRNGFAHLMTGAICESICDE